MSKVLNYFTKSHLGIWIPPDRVVEFTILNIVDTLNDARLG